MYCCSGVFFRRGLPSGPLCLFGSGRFEIRRWSLDLCSKDSFLSQQTFPTDNNECRHFLLVKCWSRISHPRCDKLYRCNIVLSSDTGSDKHRSYHGQFHGQSLWFLPSCIPPERGYQPHRSSMVVGRQHTMPNHNLQGNGGVVLGCNNNTSGVHSLPPYLYVLVGEPIPCLATQSWM